MLRLITGMNSEINQNVMYGLAEYRYEIFVKKMGWPLNCPEGFEQDEFDRPDTVYAIVLDADNKICGCARLLPTNKPYLLSEHFVHLMGGTGLPNNSETWELSRFAISSSRNGSSHSSNHWADTVALVRKVITTAIELGANRLIAVSAVGNERLLKRMGVNVHRVSVPQRVDQKPVVAFWIEIDQQTLSALDIDCPVRVISN
ncbi:MULTISPECIES: acyl-homoserine-lactone synthase [unclassified Pseudomonas]|uniref:acyl-homoserine-lactone synthase n=1 Tax=unclassified Pseudomonas TaxID=196821 RepID=UPI002160503D|nr:acyl-homoserine-lactone synthase [Pseudomonas sp. B21-015]UVM49750.1 GNAT family N-acetyltransferase [Pseudomonas sp. B21-015]